jgi:hypothetical protein
LTARRFPPPWSVEEQERVGLAAIRYDRASGVTTFQAPTWRTLGALKK